MWDHAFHLAFGAAISLSDAAIVMQSSWERWILVAASPPNGR
jgi:hypothetical protein